MIDSNQLISETRRKVLEMAIEAALVAGNAILEVYNGGHVEVEFKTDNSPLTIADKHAHNSIISVLEPAGFPILSEESKQAPYSIRKEWKKFWLVDPLDGTKEFISRNGDFTVNIAFVENGRPTIGVVFNPVEDSLYFGDVFSGSYRVCSASSFHDPRLLLGEVEQLPVKKSEVYGIVASRSHLTPETEQYINQLRLKHPFARIVSRGSALKFCLVAEGEANIYPRFSFTYEWDTAAGHAILAAIGGKVIEANNGGKELKYNKENLLNPWFIATL